MVAQAAGSTPGHCLADKPGSILSVFALPPRCTRDNLEWVLVLSVRGFEDKSGFSQRTRDRPLGCLPQSPAFYPCPSSLTVTWTGTLESLLPALPPTTLLPGSPGLPLFLSPLPQSLEDLEDQKRKKKKEKMGFGSISRVFARGKQRKSLDPGLFDGTAPDYYIEEDADW